MRVYMLKDNVTGKFYKRRRGHGHEAGWVEQCIASVWTQPSGPNACLGAITRAITGANYCPKAHTDAVKVEPVIVSLEVV